MEKYQSNFKRYEIKYILDSEQKEKADLLMRKHMIPTEFGHAVIRNIYFDTDTYRLIRSSLEKPLYKEKLRLRSYKQTDGKDDIFVEIKKKYDSVVYKRRLKMREKDAFEWIMKTPSKKPDTQIGNEIEYFCKYYGPLRPSCFLSYEREALMGREDNELRITFDNNILARTHDFSFASEVYGRAVLPAEKYIMEVKTTSSLPLWLTEYLTAEHIYKESFSKYGEAYKNMIYPSVGERHTLFYEGGDRK